MRLRTLLVGLLTFVAGAAGSAGAPAAPRRTIDEVVLAHLQRIGVDPAPLCPDAVFVRRAYLDAIGTLPTAEEARAFLLDERPNKRAALVDHLLERDEFADYWAMKWSDLLRVKSEFPINLWPNAVQAYHHWIRAGMRANVPYDRFVRELLTESGSNFRVPPVNFYRATQSRDPKAIARAVALTFMGARAERWPEERLAGMAAFFSRIGYKATAEWKEEIVLFDPGNHPAPIAAVLPDGTRVIVLADRDPREAFATWLLAPGNPWFARNIVNRVWSWLLGRGIIEEPDDIRPDNPPADPELLALLESELFAGRYDVKHIFRLVLNSNTYQRASTGDNDDADKRAGFARYRIRPLDAEVLIDALCQITGTSEEYSSAIPEPYTFVPEGHRAVALADGSITSAFLDLFGRPARDTGLESERNPRPTPQQRLHLLNASHIQRKLEQSATLQAVIQAKTDVRQMVTSLYLTILSRFPTDDEVKVATAYAQTAANRRVAGLDVAWALVNTPEFLYRH